MNEKDVLGSLKEVWNDPESMISKLKKQAEELEKERTEVQNDQELGLEEQSRRLVELTNEINKKYKQRLDLFESWVVLLKNKKTKN